MYEGMLLKYYHQFSLEFIRYELPVAQGFAYIAIGMELDGWLQFSGKERTSKAYIAKEIDKKLELVKNDPRWKAKFQ